MKIDIKALNKRVDCFLDRKNADYFKKVDKERAEFSANLCSILQAREELAKLAPIVNRVSAELKNFYTEGMLHKPGFSTRDPTLWGCCGGGFSGDSFFLDVNTGDWVKCKWYDESASSRRMSTDEVINSYCLTCAIKSKAKYMAETIKTYIKDLVDRLYSL